MYVCFKTITLTSNLGEIVVQDMTGDQQDSSQIMVNLHCKSAKEIRAMTMR